FTDAGGLYIGAGLPKNKLNEAVTLITEIAFGLVDSKKWAIKKEELETAKDTFRGRFALNFDRPETVLGAALWDLIYRDKIYTPEEKLANIERVTIEEIRALAKEIFKRENLSISVVGNYTKLDFKI
ncbi:hypothetical protein COT86_02050, partial [Candidatus Collierbacteria bacterium CG10_big_fil_rev_8_21_14_0_10_43_36]